ncbi:MAG: YceI family protein [Verrucomicrobia bacterium]|jgi:polyisoprenoid-binding protein YceI|nr:YceI family protein [Verrucomicrobiota bacterium]
MTTSSLRSSLSVAVALGATALAASAAPLAFDFKDPKGVNNVQFSLDAPLESITGTGTGISGTVTFDPAAPAKTSGKIVLEAATLTVGNPMMTDHLRGNNWLDVAQHPAITFEAVSLANVRNQGPQILADVKGKLTVKGVTKDVTVPVSFTHLPDKLGARVGDPKVKGDLLVMRASFAINRSDYGIQPGKNTDKVAETIQLTLSIAGAAKKG